MHLDGLKNLCLILGSSTFLIFLEALAIGGNLPFNPRFPDADFPWYDRANGCGPDTWIGRLIPDNSIFIGDFRQGCKNHDRCYMTVGPSRQTCDDKLLREWRNSCNDLVGPRLVQRDSCKNFANLYFRAVRSKGGEVYRESQRDAIAFLQYSRQVIGDEFIFWAGKRFPDPEINYYYDFLKTNSWIEFQNDIQKRFSEAIVREHYSKVTGLPLLEERISDYIKILSISGFAKFEAGLCIEEPDRIITGLIEKHDVDQIITEEWKNFYISQLIYKKNISELETTIKSHVEDFGTDLQPIPTDVFEECEEYIDSPWDYFDCINQ